MFWDICKTIQSTKKKEFQQDIVHAHFGLSGLFATLQRRIPTIITFHGSDINVKRNLIFSFIASKLQAEIYTFILISLLKYEIRNRLRLFPVA